MSKIERNFLSETNAKNPDYHLIVIWYNARKYNQRVLDVISDYFHIHKTLEISWSLYQKDINS